MNNYIIENRDVIFLAKLQSVISTLDEIDKMAKENPDLQKMIDYEISDYNHILQNEDLSDEQMVEIAKKLKEARLKRATVYNTFELVKTYYGNNKVLIYSHNRYKLNDAIKEKLKNLNQEYKYRILDGKTVDTLKGTTVVETNVKEQHVSKYIISKEELEEKLASGMKSKDIAKELGRNQSYVTMLKKKYGIGVREYKKRGE